MESFGGDSQRNPCLELLLGFGPVAHPGLRRRKIKKSGIRIFDQGLIESAPETKALQPSQVWRAFVLLERSLARLVGNGTRKTCGKGN